MSVVKDIASSNGGAGALRLAAQLAHPDLQVDPAALDPAGLEQAAHLLEKQKVSFIPIAGRLGAAVAGTPLSAQLFQSIVGVN